MIKPPIFTLPDGLKVQFLYFLAPPQRNLYIRLNSGPLTFSLYFLYIIPCISGLRNIGFPRDNKWFSVISELIFLERVRFLLILAHNQSGGGAGQSRDQRRGGGGGPAEPYYGFGFAALNLTLESTTFGLVSVTKQIHFFNGFSLLRKTILSRFSDIQKQKEQCLTCDNSKAATTQHYAYPCKPWGGGCRFYS